MDNKRLLKQIGLVFFGQLILLAPLSSRAQEDSIASINEDTIAEPEEVVIEDLEVEADSVAEVTLIADMDNGKALFQGEARFFNGGPTCISCHNVTHDGVAPGGLFAKDLTDVYSRMGEGLVSWLGAPPFKPMADSYNNNPLTEQERVDLTAFLKYADETKDAQTATNADAYFFIGGGIGLIIILGLIQIIWFKRKRKMVKQDIFSRQHSAVDAKF